MSYIDISSFGYVKNNPQEPLAYCVNQTVNSEMKHGVIGDLFGPNSAKCQWYMADRCAKNWDKYCDAYYMTNQGSRSYYPNMASVEGFKTPSTKLSMGDMLLRTTAQRKYLDLNGCRKYVEAFDPLVANSPPVVRYDCNASKRLGVAPKLTAKLDLDLDGVDNDPVMNLCLDNPEVCSDSLGELKKHKDRGALNLNGTRLGAFYDELDRRQTRNQNRHTRLFGSSSHVNKCKHCSSCHHHHHNNNRYVAYKNIPGPCKKQSKPGCGVFVNH